MMNVSTSAGYQLTYIFNRKDGDRLKQIAKFEKVSYEQFKKDIQKEFFEALTEEKVREIYQCIKLPIRSTKHSAGYDFMIPFSVTLSPGQSIKIPTGIRCRIDTGWVLKCYPRSGLGFKYRLHLDNVVGIIDGDYYQSDNEGHIFTKITNDSKEGKIVKLNPGDRFMQGIFVEFGITYDDDADGVRNGGFGSTGK